MQQDSDDDRYSARETQRRFESAIRGARTVGHKPMNDIPKKNGESRRKKPKKRRTKYA